MRKRVTQTDIARRVGLDVSSVNKILNRDEYAAFAKDTVARVRAVAREMGYEPRGARCGLMRSLLQRLFPKDASDEVLAGLRGVDVETVREARALIRRPKKGPPGGGPEKIA